MTIYTRTGDGGETGLFAGPRVFKDHARVEAYGTVDELNSALGVARACGHPEEINALLCRIQHELFALGAELATPDPGASKTDLIRDQHVAALEAAIDCYEAQLPPLEQFILPAGSTASTSLHLARGICRRAERRVVSLCRTEPLRVSEHTIRYLNRLGDLLFVLARVANAAAKQPDVVWEKPEAASQSPPPAAG